MNKFTLRTTLLSLSTALLLGITGCSSGGSSGGSSDNSTTDIVPKAYSGIGIDGILVGSTVCVDGNPTNGKCDAGEPSAITDDKGQFSIPSTRVRGPLILVGGTDNSTGKAFTGSLKAPAGSTVVTPLTSAIQSLVEGGKSTEDAEANVKAAMGLTSVDVNLTTFDPYNEVSAKAQAVLAKQTQLQVLVHSATVTVAGADASTDVNSTMSSVFDAIVENFDGATGAVALDADKVTAATKKAADTVYADNLAARVAAKAIAQTSAEGSVRDADAADAAISGGTPEQAADNLDAAITKANTTAEAELRAAAKKAKEEADKLTAEKIVAIAALQKAQQEKEAAIAVAKAAQEKAEADLAAAKAAAAAKADDRAKYEVFLEAQAAAEKAAKEKAQADLAAAQAKAAAATEEKAIADEAAQREAEAQAAAAQAQAEANAAAAREAAADKAAAGAKEESDLAAAQAAAQAAQAAAAVGIAQAQVNANVQIANVYVVQATRDANITRTIATSYTVAEANATTAETARDLAITAALDTNVTIDSNATVTDANASLTLSTTNLNVTATQAAIAAAALEDAYKVKAAVELAEATQVALQAKIGRLTEILVDVNSTKNAAQTLYDSGETIGNAIDANMSALGEIAANPLYVGAQAKFDDANTSAQKALKDYNDANTSLELIKSAYTDASNALVDVNKTAIENAQIKANTEKTKMDTYFADAKAKADSIAGLLVEAQAIKKRVDDTPTPVTSIPFTLPYVWYDFNMEDDIDGNGPGIRIYTTSFGDDFNTEEKRQVYYFGSADIVDATQGNDVSYILKDGSWLAKSQGVSSFTLTDNNTILNVPAYNAKVKLLSSTDISGQTMNFDGIGDVTFSQGAKMNQHAFRTTATSYELDGLEYAYDNRGQKETLPSLDEYYRKNDRSVIGDNWWIVGNDGGGVTFAEPFTTTLGVGSTGHLSEVIEPLDKAGGQTRLVGDAGTAGTWEVKYIPGTTQLGIFFNITAEKYKDESNHFVTLHEVSDTNSTLIVYRGWVSEASSEFKPFDGPSFNDVAVNDIIDAAKTINPQLTFSLETYLRGQTRYYASAFDGSTEAFTFDANGSLYMTPGGGASDITYTVNDANFTISDPNVGGLQTYVYLGQTDDGKGRNFDYYERGQYMEMTNFYENAGDLSSTLDITALYGQTIYFENKANPNIFGVRTFKPDGTTTGFISTSGQYSGIYSVNGDTITVSTTGGVDTNLTFSSQPDFTSLNGVNVSVNGVATSTWSNAGVLPSELLDVAISYKDDSNRTGERRFTGDNLAYYNGDLNAVYLYEATTGMLMIKTPTDRFDITVLKDLTNMPITKSSLSTGTTLYSGTTTWTVGTTGGTNTPPVAQNDIYLTMLVDENISGALHATDSDAGDNLTWSYLSGTSGFANGSFINGDGTFMLVAGANTKSDASMTFKVTDNGNNSDELTVHVNIIEANSNSDSNQGNYSQSNETMDLTTFNAVPTITIPGNTPLHSFWGVDYGTGVLIHDIMEFNTTSSQLIFSDNEDNETVYFTPTLSSGETNASVDESNNDTTYNVDNQVVSFKMLGSETNSSALAHDMNITMPSGAVGYKVAILMLDAEYDFWGEAKDYSQGNQDGIVYTSMGTFVTAGNQVAYNRVNNHRALVFAEGTDLSANGGNLVEVDMSSNPPYVTNANAGSWSIISDTSVNGGSADIVLVTPNNTDNYESMIYVLDDFGVNGSATNTVWQGAYRASNRVEVMYYFNDVAAQAIEDSFIVPIANLTSPAVGSWTANDLDLNLVILDNNTYFFAQATVGGGGVAGGIEYADFTVDGNDANVIHTAATAIVNTNAEDSALSSTFAYNPTNDTLTVTASDNSIITLTRNKDGVKPSAGAYIIPSGSADFDGIDAILTLDANGTYMVSNIKLDTDAMTAEDGNNEGLANAFEYGDYNITQLPNAQIQIDFTVVTDYNGDYGLGNGTGTTSSMILDISEYPTLKHISSGVPTGLEFRRVQADNPILSK